VQDGSCLDQLSPGISHFLLGKNGDPKSKIDHFRRLVESIPRAEIDIAIIKLCYVDITRNTDIDDIFSHFSRAIADLREGYKRVRFIPMTVPLTSISRGLRVRIKTLVGRSPGDIEDNIRRNAFNEMIRMEFGASSFDLAAHETRKEDGQISGFVWGKKTYAALDPDYTSDGGHLNQLGRQIIASEFVCYLA